MAQQDTSIGAGDWVKIVIAGGLVAGGVYGFYLFDDLITPLRVLSVLAGLAAGAIVFYQTMLGQTGWSFLVTARDEVRKVVWPNRKETTQTTLMVAAIVFIVAVFLWLLDTLLLWAVRILTGQGG